MRNADLLAGVIYALRTSPRYIPTPVLLLDTRLWNEPKRGHHDHYRIDPHATRFERNDLYGDSGYLVVYGAPNILGALVLPEQITEDSVATLRAELAQHRDGVAGLTMGVVNNAHLVGQFDDVKAQDDAQRRAEADRAEADRAEADRAAETRAAEDVQRARFNAAGGCSGTTTTVRRGSPVVR